jgi:hypothetical protein
MLTVIVKLPTRRRHRQRQAAAASEATYHPTAKIYDQHFPAADLMGTRQCYQTVVHGKGNEYDYTMELRPLPTVPAYTADPSNACTQPHCQCYSPYNSFQYGGSESPLIALRSVAPHYFTLDPKRGGHDPTCMLMQPDVTQQPLITAALADNEENNGKEGDITAQTNEGDNGTCSWP